MNIIEKLKLQSQSKNVLLIREGAFLRAYGESCYLLTQKLNHQLKVQCVWIKCVNDWVISCAFPDNKLTERLPKAVLTEFGATLTGDFDTKGYQRWYELHCQRASAASELTVARIAGAQEPAKRATEEADFYLPMTQKQVTFLFNWQKNHYPPELEEAFFTNLQRVLNQTL